MAERYEIRITGRLTPALAKSFGEMRAWVAPRATVLRVRLTEGADAARLLELLGGLGLEVVALRRIRTELST